MAIATFYGGCVLRSLERSLCARACSEGRTLAGGEESAGVGGNASRVFECVEGQDHREIFDIVFGRAAR